MKRKPKTRRSKRFLETRQPLLEENDKKALILRGGQTSNIVTQAMKDIHMLKKPLSTMFQKKNIMRPFDDQSSLEFFAQKCDTSLFLFGSHSKKRPHNLVFGRMFDYHVLDMFELGIEKYIPMSEFPGSRCAMGTKPCLLFAGEIFDTDAEYKRLKNLLMDFFRGPSVEQVRLAGLEHVIQFTAHDGKLHLRSYRVMLKKSGTRIPRVELEEMGPSLDLVMRRTHLASDDLFKRACKTPKAVKVPKKKNVSRDAFGTKLGRIHMEKQNLDKLKTRKMKGLKRQRKGDSEDASASKSKKSKNDSE